MKTVILALLSLAILQPSFAKAMEARPTLAMEHSKREQEELNCDLFVAIGNMNLKKIEELLNAGASANTTNRFGKTVLMHAAQNDYKRISQLLLKHGAQVNARRESGETALYYAISKGHEQMCKFLLMNGANPDDKAEQGPALIFAADLNFFSVCKVLLDHNADLTAQDRQGNTAFMYAARKRWIHEKCFSVEEKTLTTLEKICLLFLNHQRRLNNAILALLTHWKKNNNALYRQRCVLMPYLKKFTLEGLLNMKRNDGDPVYRFMKAEWLKPKEKNSSDSTNNF